MKQVESNPLGMYPGSPEYKRPARFDGMDLSGIDLSGQDLRESSFFEANLRGANFKGANISQTKFCKAILGQLPQAVKACGL